MIWIGPLLGAFIGSWFRLGPIGSLVCSILGGYAEAHYRWRRRGGARTRRADAEPRRDDARTRAYRTLGLGPGASVEEAKRAYRALAKECHPDVLRARGASEREIAEATERMARLNAAWNLIRNG